MVAAKLTVLAILTVAIHIAILLLRHINAVDDDGNFWKFLFFGNLIDNRQTCLRCVVCTANVNCGVSNPADMECVCYQTDRSRINKDVVIMFSQVIEDYVKALVGQKLCRVRRNRASHEQFKVVIYSGRNYLSLDFIVCRIGLNKQRRDSVRMVVSFKEFGKTRLANVKTYNEYFLVEECETDGKVGAVERLSLARVSGSEYDNL